MSHSVNSVVALLQRALGVTRARQQFGQFGEDLACRELERRGYVILTRRYRQQGGDLDIIARDGEAIVFVEVKARDGRDYGDASEAVTNRKRSRMTQLALDYLARNNLTERPCRFDVVSIHMENELPVVEVYRNAFDASANF
jgi:putative endonuclease